MATNSTSIASRDSTFQDYPPVTISAVDFAGWHAQVYRAEDDLEWGAAEIRGRIFNLAVECYLHVDYISTEYFVEIQASSLYADSPEEEALLRSFVALSGFSRSEPLDFADVKIKRQKDRLEYLLEEGDLARLIAPCGFDPLERGSWVLPLTVILRNGSSRSVQLSRLMRFVQSGAQSLLWRPSIEKRLESLSHSGPQH